MEEGGLIRKRRRVYSFEPSRMVLPHRAIFSQRYMNTLLPALLKIVREKSSSNEKEDYEIEKIVRFQVDMALALSTECRFGWSHALKQKLDHQTHMNSKNCSVHVPKSLLFTYNQNGISSPYYCGIKNHHNTPVVPNITGLSLACNFTSQKYSKRSKRLVSWQGRKTKRSEAVDDKQFECRLRTLRKILPGGDNMGAYELLSEVESYVVCLELQVSVLRSLVDIH